MEIKKFTVAIIMLIVTGLTVAGGAAAETQCSPELLEAMKNHLGEIQYPENMIRESTRQEPFGVVPTKGFDLAAHECHTMAGQAYKVYGEGKCVPGEEEWLAIVKYPFKLFYRKAPTEEELFELNWNAGTDGLWRVTFEETHNGWVAVGQREELDLDGGGGGGSGHPEGGGEK